LTAINDLLVEKRRIPMKKISLFTFIALALLLAACSAAAPYDTAVPGMAAPEPAYAGDAYTEEYTGNQVASLDLPDETPERMIIKDASLDIVASDPAQTMDEIAQMAEGLGGYVVGSSVYQRYLEGGGTAPQADITVRVPAEKLDEAIQTIEGKATTVENKTLTSDDITQEYTDLESQLRNLEAAEAQLMKIMEDATDTDEVLQVYEKLVQVRGQIEAIKGRMQYYEQAVALSKIEVSITADEAVQPLQIGGWRPAGVAKQAIETMIRTLQFFVNAGIWLVLCVLPIGLLIGVPLFFIVRWANRKRKQRKTEKAAPEA
jgi:hypothetical protein